MMTLVAVAAISAAGALPTFDAFFEEFARKRDAIENLQAQFEQENTTPEETTHAKGGIVYARPRSIKFSYAKVGGGTTYLISGDKAYVYDPEVKQLEIRSIKDRAETEAFFLGFSNDTKALREAYEVALFEPEDPALAKYGIVLRPKKEAEAAPFQEVRLYLRDADLLPVKIRILNDEDASVNIQIVEIKTNLPAADVGATLNVPEGAKVIEDDQVIETVGAGGKTFPAATPPAPGGK